MKKGILLTICGVFLPSIALADVSSISVLFGANGMIKDIQTSLTSDTMAITAPIVEPDGTETDPEAPPSEEEMETLFMDPEESEDPEEPEDGNAGDEEESESDPVPKGDTENVPMANENACTNAGGTGTVDNCTCPASGTLTVSLKEYNGAYNCCDSSGRVYLNGSYTHYLIPQCGCSNTAGIYPSFKTGANDLKICCQGYKRVTSNALTGYEIIPTENDDEMCGCPSTFKGKNVVDKTTSPTELRCCAGDNLIQDVNNWDVRADICGCKEDASHCTDSTTCTANNKTWCPNGGPNGQGICSSGECQVPCPEDGNVQKGVCCKNGQKGTIQSDGTYQWVDDFEDCGCPNGGNWNSEEESVCCDAGLAWNGTAYATTDARCGCPSGYTPSTVNEIICCGTGANAGKIHPTQTGTDAEVVRWCGCASGEYDKSTGLCVPCLTDNFCSNKDSTKPYCWKKADDSNNECVGCLYSGHCSTTASACEPSQTEKVCDPTTHTCKTCGELSSNKTWRWRANNGKDSTNCNSCYQCTKDADCGSGKVCDADTLTCVLCSTSTHHGCENATIDVGGEAMKAPFCIQKDASTRICSECQRDADCSNKAGGRRTCVSSQGVCASDCGTQGYNRETGECNCPASAPVYDIYRKKCVVCYDSISGAWTDLGCNVVPSEKKQQTGVSSDGSARNYSPWQAAKNNKPVCIVANTSDLGTCVECATDDQCEGEKLCRTDSTHNHQCGCPDANPNFNASTGKCVECRSNYGGATKACAQAKKPLCKDGFCTCDKNYDSSSKKDKDGMCPENMPVCHTKDNVKECKTCISAYPSKPKYDRTSKECVSPCGENSTFSNGKCVCNAGYGISTDSNKCVSANLPSIGECSTLSRTGSGASCYTNIFNFTTVANIKYHVKFNNVKKLDDYVKFWLDGTEKKHYCRNRSTDVNDCNSAAATDMKNSDAFNFVGNGKVARLAVMNASEHASCESKPYPCNSEGNTNTLKLLTITVHSDSNSYTPTY